MRRAPNPRDDSMELPTDVYHNSSEQELSTDNGVKAVSREQVFPVTTKRPCILALVNMQGPVRTTPFCMRFFVRIGAHKRPPYCLMPNPIVNSGFS